MKINIQSIKHELQRYETCGDWQFEAIPLLKVGDVGVSRDITLNIKISKTGSFYTDCLLAIHEMIEAILCKSNGVKEKDVDDWDIAHIDHPDPGSIPGCPYYKEHMFALMIERCMAHELQVDWDAYEHTLENL